MDFSAIDHGAECPDVTRRGWVELRSLQGGGTPLSVPPLLGVVALEPGQPLCTGRKPALVPSKGSPILLLSVLQNGLLGRLARRERAPEGFEQRALALPRPPEDFGPFLPVPLGDPTHLLALFVDVLRPAGGPLLVVLSPLLGVHLQ